MVTIPRKISIYQSDQSWTDISSTLIHDKLHSCRDKQSSRISTCVLGQGEERRNHNQAFKFNPEVDTISSNLHCLTHLILLSIFSDEK
jgi:hypothetical protein